MVVEALYRRDSGGLLGITTTASLCELILRIALHCALTLANSLSPFLSFLCRLVSSSHPGHPLGPVMVPLVLGTAHPSCRTSSFSRSSLATAWSSVVVAVAVVVDVENPQPTVQ